MGSAFLSNACKGDSIMISAPDVSTAGGQGQPAAGMRAFDRFIGLDVHKRTVVAAVFDAAGEHLHGESFDCTAEALRKFAAEQLTPTTAAALEATSNTWAVAAVLQPRCGKLVVSNPMKTKAIAQGAVKTDKVDAGVLAHLLRCDYLPGVWIPDEQTRKLRQITTRRTTLVQDRTAIRNRIHSHLAGELIPVPAEVADLFGEKGLTWLKELTAASEQTRGFLDSDLRLLEALGKEIELLNGQLAQIAYRQEQAKLLMTMPGVDYPVALSLLAVLGDIRRFPDGDHAASYLGLVASTLHQAVGRALLSRADHQAGLGARPLDDDPGGAAPRRRSPSGWTSTRARWGCSSADWPGRRTATWPWWRWPARWSPSR
jgi:transposase